MLVRLDKSRILRKLTLVVVMLLVAWPVGAWAAARFLIVNDPLPRVDAIVVLSGSATFRERARHAAALYKQGKANRIILTNDNLKSGWSAAAQRNPYYHELAKEELKRNGVAEKDVEIIMVPIAGTHDEAMKLRDYCTKHEVNSIEIVTSAYHSRRALRTFRQVFRDTGKQVGMDPVIENIETPSPSSWWLHKFGWAMVPNEYMKLVGYWWRYE